MRERDRTRSTWRSATSSKAGDAAWGARGIVRASRKALVAAAVLALAAVARPQAPTAEAAPRARAPAQVLLTVEEALKLAFPGCEIEKRTLFLTREQMELAGELAGEEIPSAIAYAYVARKDGRLAGTAYFDAHRVRTLRETLMVVVDPARRVRRVELCAFAEPKEYAPRAPWYAQFTGRVLDDELNLKRGIRGIAGATLSARAATSAVRRLLAVHRVLEKGNL
jgi:hypothetical protein